MNELYLISIIRISASGGLAYQTFFLFNFYVDNIKICNHFLKLNETLIFGFFFFNGLIYSFAHLSRLFFYILGRGPNISVGDRSRNGARARVSEALGIRACRRDHLGQNQPAAEDHQNWPHRALAQPREGALSGGRQGQPPYKPGTRL